MTYVNGGALIDCFAPLMTSSNWKTFIQHCRLIQPPMRVLPLPAAA